MRVLLLDTNHPLIQEELLALGFQVDEDYTSDKETVKEKIGDYQGIVIRSRFSIDQSFIDAATSLRFIARVGAGLENIDISYALSKKIHLFKASEGNRDAVAEHAMGMLLSIMNKLPSAHQEIREGKWIRAANRGHEIMGKTVGIIGYGVMGKAFATRLKGFGCKVICYDILPDVGNQDAQQVDLDTLFRETDILSLHTPQTPETLGMINTKMIYSFRKNIYFVNTARGKSVVTDDLVSALKEGKILAAALDVLEYENSSFEHFFEEKMPASFQYLLEAPNVLLSPHIAGWTHESNIKMAQIIIEQVKQFIKNG